MENNKQQQVHPGKKGFLFNVDILMEGYTNGIALEALLSILNTEKINDFKINSGIELGKIIEGTRAQVQTGGTAAPVSQTAGKNKTSPVKPEEAKNDDKEMVKLIEYFKNNNTLVRLSVIKAKGIQLSLPCRILNFDENAMNLTVYHVDEKKVYQFDWSEIDDFKVN